MFKKFVKIFIVEVFLGVPFCFVFLIRGKVRSGAGNITLDYLWEILEGNISEEYEFVVIPLFLFIVYGPTFPVY